MMHFEVMGEISEVETFATGSGIRELARLRKVYGRGRWRKRKGIACVRFPDGAVQSAEVHRYEASGIGIQNQTPPVKVKPSRSRPNNSSSASTTRAIRHH